MTQPVRDASLSMLFPQVNLLETMHSNYSLLIAANKSVVSSSMGTEYTFFQTLDDHMTQPVLFIPETHLSSLQRMVSPRFLL